MSEDQNPLSADDHALQKKKEEVIKDKFLLVAKEKSQLESVILDLSDRIKKLEKERDALSLTLNKYTNSNNNLKEKLLELDTLRNIEISELKKKIDLLLSENRQLIDEKNVIPQERPTVDTGVSPDAQIQPSRLPDMTRELKNLLEMKEHNLSAASERVRQLEKELSSMQNRLKHIEDERNSLKSQIDQISLTSAPSEPEKRYSEQELENEIDFYSKEILSLKSDIEVLTATVKEKTKQADNLNKKVEDLDGQLSQKDVTLYEKIPLLQAGMQQLSNSIEKKTLENSTFARELAELNGRLSALTGELEEQEQIARDISERYCSEKENDADMLQAIKSAKDQTEAENAELRSTHSSLLSENQQLAARKTQLEAELFTLEDKLASISSHDEAISLRVNTLEAEKQALETKLSEARQKIEGLEANVRSNLAVLESKDQFIMETNTELEDLKIMLTSLRSSKQELEVAKNQLELELEHLKTGMPDLKAEIELLRSEKYRIETEKDQLGAELAEVSASLDDMQSEDPEVRQRIRELEDEKQELESKLSAALQKIDVQVADTQSLNTLLESRDIAITEANAEIEDFKIMITSLRSSKQELEIAKKQLETELEHLRVGIADLTAEIELLRSEKHRIEAEKDHISAELAEVSASLDDMQSEDPEVRQRIRELEDEKQGLESKLSTALQKIDELVADTLSHQTLLESKDRFLREEKTEKEYLQAELASLNSEKQRQEEERNHIEEDLARLKDELEKSREQGKESGQLIENMENEKQSLEASLLVNRQRMAEMEEETNRHVSALASHKKLFSDIKAEAENSRSAIEALDKENAALKDSLLQKEAEFSHYSSEKSELLKKISVLEEAFRILRDDNYREQSAGPYASQRPANIVPATTYQKEKVRPYPKYALYVVMLVAVVMASFYFSKHYKLSGITRHRSPVTVDVDTNLGYREIYDRNTRAADSKNIKVQATVFSESLLLKEENPDLEGFDFNKYIYFKVNINSLEGPLDAALVRNPLDALKLTEDSNTIDMSGYKQIDKIKTFFKRQAPIAVTFFCAFPKSALGPDRKDLTLTLSDNGVTIPLAWDVQTLIANKI